jgi:hypothetical protein
METDMVIIIRFLRRGESAPHTLELSPEEYFDPPDNGEVLVVRSVPKYQDAYRYTGYKEEDMCWTVLDVSDGSDFWRVRSQLLEGARSQMTHSSQPDGSEEIIHQTEICPGCWHTIRTLKLPSQSWAVTMNHLTVEKPGHLSGDRDFCGKWSFQDLKAFGEVA